MLQEKLQDHNIILASGSPRRQELFKQLGINFEIRLKKVPEIYPPELMGHEITDYLAELKAAAFEGELKKSDILVTSDTIVWHEGKALEKPRDAAQAFGMIRSLCGKTHEVITSVSFKTMETIKTVHEITEVTFGELDPGVIQEYIEQYQPFDKAGAYGIQEWIGLVGVRKIAGSYFNVVGLPTHLVYLTLLKIIEKSRN